LLGVIGWLGYCLYRRRIFAGRVLVKSRYGTTVCLSSYSRRPTIRCKIFMHISTRLLT
jgi:hypothetical protein